MTRAADSLPQLTDSPATLSWPSKPDTYCDRSASPVPVMTSRVLSIALQDIGQPPLRPLPIAIAELLDKVDAPPRLVAHLRAVHDVAAQLLEWIAIRNLDLGINPKAVLFGTAIHDIGKTLHPGEVSGPGSQHEEAGRELLMAQGVDSVMARFAATHAAWNVEDPGMEDLLVSTLGSTKSTAAGAGYLGSGREPP